MNDSISIRPFLPDDLNAILKIWLSANLQAHDFIDAAYWADHLEMVRDLLPQAEIYVYQKNGRAVRFYLREGFTCAEEHVDSATGESELLLTWENKS